MSGGRAEPEVTNAGINRRPCAKTALHHAEPYKHFGMKNAFATAAPLTPDAFADPDFGPKPVFAGALSAGCQ